MFDYTAPPQIIYFEGTYYLKGEGVFLSETTLRKVAEGLLSPAIDSSVIKKALEMIDKGQVGEL